MANKYIIGLDLDSALPARLDQVISQMGRLINMYEHANAHMGSMDNSLKKITDIEKTRLLMEVADKWAEMSEKVEHAAHKIIDASAEFVKDIVKDASMFEDAQSAMQFAFGTGWQEQYDKLLKTSTHLTFKFSEVLGLATGLGRMHVDPFGGAIKSAEGFKSKTGEVLDAFEVIQDVVGATNRDIGTVQRGILEAMAGNFREFKQGLMFPHELLEKIKKGMAGATDQQAKYNSIIKELGEYFGGAGRLKMENYSMQLLQVADVMEQLKGRIGLSNLKAISQAIHEFVDSIKSLLDDEDKMKALGSGFAVLESAVAQVIHWVAGAVKWMGELVKTLPWLPKLAGYFTVASVAGLVLTSTVLGVTAALIGTAAAIAAIGVETLAVVGILSIVAIPVFALLGITALSAGLLAKAAAEVTKENWGGVGNSIENVRLVFLGLTELIDSYNGSTGKMSMETAAKLKKAGVYDIAVDLFMAFHRLSVMWTQFKEALDDATEKLGPVVIPLLYELRDLAIEFAQAMGLVSGTMGVAGSDADDWAMAGYGLAQMFVQLAEIIAVNLRVFIFWARMGAVAFNMLNYAIDAVESSVEYLIRPFAVLSDYFGITENAAARLTDRIEELSHASHGVGSILDQINKVWNPSEGSEKAVDSFNKRPGKQPQQFTDEELRNLAGMKPDEIGPPPAAPYESDYLGRRRQRERSKYSQGGVPMEESDAYQRAYSGMKPGQIGPPQAPSPVEAQVANNTAQTNDLLQKLIAMIGSGTISIDGQAIAKVVHNANQGVAGVK